MAWLSPNDIENLKLRVEPDAEEVTIPIEAFEELLSDYVGYYYDRHGDLCRQ